MAPGTSPAFALRRRDSGFIRRNRAACSSVSSVSLLPSFSDERGVEDLSGNAGTSFGSRLMCLCMAWSRCWSLRQAAHDAYQLVTERIPVPGSLASGIAATVVDASR